MVFFHIIFTFFLNCINSLSTGCPTTFRKIKCFMRVRLHILRCGNLHRRGYTFNFYFRLEMGAFLLIANFHAAPEILKRAHYSGSVHLRSFLIDYILDWLQRLWIFLSDFIFHILLKPKIQGIKIRTAYGPRSFRTSANHSIRELLREEIRAWTSTIRGNTSLWIIISF